MEACEGTPLRSESFGYGSESVSAITDRGSDASLSSHVSQVSLGSLDDNSQFMDSFSNRMSSSLRRLTSTIERHIGEIGMLGSVSIAMNSLTGPAMLNLPAIFDEAGVIPTITTLVFMCILSALCSMYMANCISKVQGNKDFKKEIEFAEAFRRFMGWRWFVFAQIAFFCCITCLNIIAIVDTAQTFDSVLGAHNPYFGSAAIQIRMSGVEIVTWDSGWCTNSAIDDGNCIPYQYTGGVLLTLGYFLTCLLFLPMSFMDLKENVLVQILLFIYLLGCTVLFVIDFINEGLLVSNVSLWGDDWSGLFGVSTFNFVLVLAIPAWLYEKEPHVDVPTVVYGSSVGATLLYIIIGLLGNLAIPDVSENLLQSMMSGNFGSVTEVASTIFALLIVGWSIPLFCVFTRLSFTGSRLCSRFVANIGAVYLPFSIGWLCYSGDAVLVLQTWGGLVSTSFVVFILPLILSLQTVHEEGSLAVYLGYEVSKSTERRILWILLVLAVLSVLAAFFTTVTANVDTESQNFTLTVSQ